MLEDCTVARATLVELERSGRPEPNPKAIIDYEELIVDLEREIAEVLRSAK